MIPDSAGDAVVSQLSKPTRILVVDDEPAVGISMARSLANHGYHVTCVTSGEEAIKLIDVAATPFDLVISDVVMKGMSGVALAKLLRAREEPVRVLLVSGYPGNHLADGLVTTGQVELIPKPFTPTELVERARAAISRNRTRQSFEVDAGK